MKKKVLIWEIIGAVLITLVGTFLHFLYELAGKASWSAPFGATNESVWEHLKIAFWPFILFAIIEYFFIGKVAKNFFLAKASGAIVTPLTIVILFYTYTFFTGTHILFMDILIFVVAIILGQFVSYKLLTAKNDYPAGLSIISVVVILLLAILFIVFSFYPPDWIIFQDPEKEAFLSTFYLCLADK